MNAVISFFDSHTTKLLGFLQVTAGALAVADQSLITSLFGPNGIRWIILATGVLTAWRGFANSAAQAEAAAVSSTTKAQP